MYRKILAVLSLLIAAVALADDTGIAHHDNDWWQQVARDIRASEYQVRPSAIADEFVAINRTQNLKARISWQGVSVGPRVEQGDHWSMRLSLVGVEQFGAIVTLGISNVIARDRTVRFDRGDLVEAVTNAESGLSLTVDFFSSFASDQESALVFEIETTLDVVADTALSRLDFYRDGNRTATLSIGAAADNASQATTVQLRGNTLRITTLAPANSVQMVLTSAATADTQTGPSQTPDWILDEEQAGSAFAFSVAPAGDVDGDGFSDVIVGAPDFDIGQPARAGRALLYRGSASGLMTTPSWTVDGSQDGERFGASVASAGDFDDDGFSDIVVGAPASNTATVFPGSATGAESIGLPITSVGGRFGFAVASAGDVNGDDFDDLVIGAPDGANGGVARIHFGPDNSMLPSVINAPVESSCRTFPIADCDQGAAGAMFGFSVASAGDVDGDGYADVIIGAPFYEFSRDVRTGTACDVTGGAFVFLGNRLIPSMSTSAADWCSEPVGGADPQPQSNGNAEIGYSVAGAGDVNGDGFDDVIVGSPRWTYEVCTQCTSYGDVGAALLYQADPNGTGELFDLVWAGIGILNETNPVPITGFGTSVAGAGDVNGDGIADVIVGSPDMDGDSLEQGSAYLYFGSRTGDPQDSGLAYADSQELRNVFDNSALTNNMIALLSTASSSVDGTERRGNLGRVVASAGDVNSDGFSDLFISENARASVFRAAAGVPNSTRFDNQVVGDAVASAGDVDADGLDDIIVENNGAVTLHYGSSRRFGQPLNRRQSLGNGADAFAGAGDINGDGYADIAVARVPSGVDIYSGANPAVIAWSIAASSPGFGSVVATAGDVNGDGYSDLLIGDPDFVNAQGAVGRAWLFLGSGSGFATGISESDADWMANGEVVGAQFANSVSSAGDINADGYSDVVIGAPGVGPNVEGRAFVYLGSQSTPLGALSWSGTGAFMPDAEFGSTVASAGDVNGDGFGDIVVGAPGTELYGEPEVGQTFAYLGSSSGLGLVEAWTFDGLQGGDRFGEFVGAIGDTNADGMSDLAVSNLVFLGAAHGLSSSAAWSNTSTASLASPAVGNVDFNGDGFTDVVLADDSGNVRVFLGNQVRHRSGSPAGVPRRVLQEDGGVSVAPLGVLTGTSFDIRVQSANKIGKYRLEWEVKPLGEAFDGSEVQMGTVQEVLTPVPIDLTATVGPLDAGTPYRWRARVLSESITTPRTPWFSITGGVQGTHLVTDGARAASPFSSIGPAQNVTVFADSDPLVFQWHAGTSAAFEIEWSGNDLFEMPAVTSGSLTPPGNDIETYAPDEQEWIDILKLANNPDFREAPIFWRVIADGGTPSEIRALRLAAAVGAALVSPADGQSAFVPPTVTWDANHNEAFQIQFSANDFLGEPLIVVANDDDAEDSTADFGITRTSFTIPAAIWSNVEALVAPGTDGTGIVYFAVRGQDALARTSISEVRSLRVNATGTAVNNPPPKKKSGGGGFSLIWLLILAALSMIRGASPSGTAPRKS